jgi:SnoaL-like domain
MSTTQTDRYARVHEFLAAADRRHREDYDRFLSPSVVLRFGNAEPTIGLEQVKARSAQTPVKAMRHQLLGCVADDAQDTLAIELVVHYTRPDGRELSYPAAVFAHFDADNLIDDYRIYADISTLWD